jgi:vitamin B12 transporter
MTPLVSTRATLGSLALAIAMPCAIAQTTQQASIAAVVVTAARTAQGADDILADYTLISADDIARSNQHSVIDLLQAQRGIEVARNGGPGTNASVFIRGADSKQNIVLVDGVRIGSSTLGAANWSALPLANIDHIEIIYGPLSTMYGADAIGGVVQIFTRRGAGAPSVSAFAGGGSDATRTFNAAVSGKAERLSYALSAGRERAAGFSATKPGNFSYNPDNDGYTRDSASGQLVFDVATGHELGALFLHSRLDAQYDSGPTYDARSRQTLANLALFANDRITAQWSSHFQLTRAADKSGSDSSAAASGKSQIDTTQTGASWQNDIALGADMLQLLAERRVEKVVSSSTPVLSGERSTNSVAASYQLKRGAYLASVSARDDDSSQYGSNTSGAIGVGYRITPALRLGASAGTSFRAPTFNELYYPSFGVPFNKPEHGKNAEAGIHFDSGSMQLSAVYFSNRVSDLLVTAAVCPVDAATHPFGCAYNVDHGKLSGTSIAGSTQWNSFALNAALDWQDPRDTTTGKALPRRAREHAHVGIEYGAGPFKAGVDLVASGKRFDDVANRNVLGGYGLLNLNARYAFARDWSALLRLDNVTNKHYELARTYATPGIKLFAGVRYGMP